ncbi:tyrosine-type recombinase/integrase [Streptomyces sp. NPDC013953]|uniref:tyrosine-type recombinase/integrase n=1 Tax=Streptomyces sp. NPDC013953 TaxID=3364868 RepID=UPI0036FE1D9F
MTAALEPVTSHAQVATWTARHGADAAARLAAAEHLADALGDELTPPNTAKTYRAGWRVWQRFCTDQDMPLLEGGRGALVAFCVWMLREGRQRPAPDGTRGYAPTAAEAHLSSAVVGLRERGVEVSKDAAATAREVLQKLTVRLAKEGERRGRGKAAPADPTGLRRITTSTPDTLTGKRDLALVLIGFHFASRASEVSALLMADVTEHPEGLRINVASGKTVHSVRNVAVPYGSSPVACPVRAWQRWHAALAELDQDLIAPGRPAFRQIDRWGHLGGSLSPDAVTRAITRVAKRSGVPIRWTGHSLRRGLPTTARRHGRDAVAIARQGGWAPGSKMMLDYMEQADDWTDNASAGLL